MMSVSVQGLRTLLSDSETRGPTAIPRPARRWKARVLLPILILGTTAALLAYSARSALLPVTEVWVAPVVAAPHANPSELDPTVAEIPQGGGIQRRGAMLLQGPGWIEPAPYAVSVPALTDGVVKDVLVLAGDRVHQGQVVVRLIDEDAHLNCQAADAQLAALKADVTKAQAEVLAGRSRVTEIEDQLSRARQLVATGGGADGERAQWAIRLQAAGQAVEALEAAVAVALANVRKQEVACAEAQLTLLRTQIVSPVNGVVMSLFVEPGRRISMGGRGAAAGSESMTGAVMRIYDPTTLQVRVEVPLADFAKLRIGSQAEVVTEALPDTVFQGVLTRIVHEANIQRNTVPVKVSIENPSEVLKPEMLARVRFYGGPDALSAPTNSTGNADQTNRSGLRLLIPESSLFDHKAEHARVWMVKHDDRGNAMIAMPQEVQTAPSRVPGYVEVLIGLQAGDRVIMDPPANLESGDRVRVLGEKPGTQSGLSETQS